MTTLVRLAWRNLWRHPRRTAITALSIALGYALALLVYGLNDGAHEQMIRNAIRLGEGHLTVQPEGYQASPANHRFLAQGGATLARLEALHLPGRLAPRIHLQVLASTARNALGVQLVGIDPPRDPQATSLREAMIAGTGLDSEDPRGLLIGHRMAEKLDARVGSKIVLMAGRKGGDIEAQLGRVRGIFRSGIDELDSFVMYSALPLAQRVLVAEEADPAAFPLTRIAVFLDAEERIAESRARILSAGLPEGTVVLDWQEVMPHLVTFVALDDAGSHVTVGLLLVLVAFGILNTILMSVLERTREFGLLRALGMGRIALWGLVVIETVTLAIVSLAAGWLVGGPIHLWWATEGLDLSGFYGDGLQSTQFYLEPVIHSSLSFSRVAALTLVVIGATMLSGLYPAFRAARVTPIRALQT